MLLNSQTVLLTVFSGLDALPSNWTNDPFRENCSRLPSESLKLIGVELKQGSDNTGYVQSVSSTVPRNLDMIPSR